MQSRPDGIIRLGKREMRSRIVVDIECRVGPISNRRCKRSHAGTLSSLEWEDPTDTEETHRGAVRGSDRGLEDVAWPIGGKVCHGQLHLSGTTMNYVRSPESRQEVFV